MQDEARAVGDGDALPHLQTPNLAQVTTVLAADLTPLCELIDEDVRDLSAGRPAE